VAAARASGRAALDSALQAWASPRAVAPGDGVVLAELTGKELGLNDLFAALEAAGFVRDEVKAALARLANAGLVEPLPLASQPAF
jgi:hypothetical protein